MRLLLHIAQPKKHFKSIYNIKAVYFAHIQISMHVNEMHKKTLCWKQRKCVYIILSLQFSNRLNKVTVLGWGTRTLVKREALVTATKEK